MSLTKKEMIAFCDRNLGGYSKAKKIAGSTLSLEYADGATGIVFHTTQIILKKANGNIQLFNGGFYTKTTKDRINEYTSLKVRQVKGSWYVNGKLFYEGIEFNSKGGLVTEDKTTDGAAQKALLKKIKAFSNLVGLVDGAQKGIPLPNGGDCWYCSLRDNKGVGLGELSGNVDHLLNHIAEGYVNGSLIANALREKGYRDEAIGLHLSGTFGLDSLRKSVYDYMKKRLVTGQESNWKAYLETIAEIEAEQVA